MNNNFKNNITPDQNIDNIISENDRLEKELDKEKNIIKRYKIKNKIIKNQEKIISYNSKKY